MRKRQEKLIDYAKFPGSQSKKGPGAQGKALTETWTLHIWSQGCTIREEAKRTGHLRTQKKTENKRNVNIMIKQRLLTS